MQNVISSKEKKKEKEIIVAQEIRVNKTKTRKWSSLIHCCLSEAKPLDNAVLRVIDRPRSDGFQFPATRSVFAINLLGFILMF